MPASKARHRPEPEVTGPAELDANTSGAAALEALCRDHLPKLVSLCRKWAGEDAEDLAQEALLKALRNIDRFDPSRSIWPWVTTIARHLAIDRARRNGGSGKEVALGTAQIDGPSPTHGLDPEEALLLREALGALPKRQRVAVALRYLEDRSGRESAAVLDVTPLAFRQLLFRARDRLQTEYRRLGGMVPALILVPTRRLRRRAEAVRDRIGSALAPRSPQLEALLSPVAAQVVTGLVAAALVLGGGTGVFGASSQSAPWPHVLPAAAKAARGGKQQLALQDGIRAGASARGDHSGGRGNEPPLVERASDHVRGSAEEITDPHRGVKQPEHARITSVAFSPAFDADGTVYAAGYAGCRTNACPHVLFRSADGGSSWDRLPAANYFGETLVLPPGFGFGDARIFAMGPAGLQVSENEGESFQPAAAAGPPNARGSVAVSPAFGEGDPTMLIGAHTLMRYRDDLRTIEAVPSTAMPGPLEPAYAPRYPEDGRVVMGGFRVDPLSMRATATVFTCTEAFCTSTPLEDLSGVPKIRLDAEFSTTGLAYAFTPRGLYVSRDGGVTFESVATPHPEALLWDVRLSAGPGGLVAAVTEAGARGRAAGVWTSDDEADSWQRIRHPLLSSGVTSLAAHGELLIAALADRGIACSPDGGRSWASRC